MTLVAAVSNVCPSNEIDELSVSLLAIFEHRGKTFDLVEILIKQEIEDTGMSLSLSVLILFFDLLSFLFFSFFPPPNRVSCSPN